MDLNTTMPSFSPAARPMPCVTQSQQLYRRARQIIPGATQLFGKRAELQLPELWPAYYSRAKGCRVWDLDGNEYLDFTMCGIGACVLGYADPDVEQATLEAIRSGSMTTLNCPEDVQLAELLIELHPWASMVRYARTGGEIMAMAVRVARAATGREKIAFCGYHGWHDWYLAVNLRGTDELGAHLLPGLEPAGVPRGLAETAFPFRYNQIGDLEAIIAAQGNELAAIVLEVARDDGPNEGFLEAVRTLATRAGAVLIFDEITSGWRVATSGLHMQYKVYPDLAAFAKTMSNGFPMAALIGRGAVMDHAQRTFISSAYWSERIGPAAALATLRKHRQIDAGTQLGNVGTTVRDGWQQLAKRHGVSLRILGLPVISRLAFAQADSLGVLTLFVQEMLRRGFLASDRFYPTCAHGANEIGAYLSAVDEVFALLAQAVEANDVRARLLGPVRRPGFGRLN